ncbi:MAG: right-handed parallel beta-helix repeat-containing protein [Candidatus Kapabacteria bacterium]|nr:right-handed parallel beta-helix repeat-containing protein [Candidatus Kapabacteria bacterium]
MKVRVQHWLLSLVALLTLGICPALAQLQAQYGPTTGSATGTFSSWSPYQRYWGSGKVQYIIRASELATPTAGNAITPGARISQLAFFVNQLSGDAGVGWRISIGHTTTTAFTGTAFLPDASTQVFGPQTISYTADLVANAWNTYTFSTPFTWNGVDNLLVEVCDNNSGWPTHPSVIWYSPGFNASLTGNGGTSAAFNGCGMTTATGIGVGINTFRPSMRFTFLPAGIESSFPEDVDPRRILSTFLYDGSSATVPKPSVTARRGSTAATYSYRIYGPLPNTNLVYRGLNSANVNDTLIQIPVGSTPVLQTNNFSTGPLGGGSGIGDGSLDARNAVGGSYRLEVQYTNASTGVNQLWSKNFIIAFQNDISILELVSPQAAPRKYLRGVDIPVAARIQNVGLSNATSFRAIATIAQTGGTVIRRDTVFYNDAIGLATGGVALINFPNFNTINVNNYTVQVCVDLLNGNDQNLVNNCTETRTFEVQYDTEVEANAILNPTASSQNFVNRPLRVLARFRNNGASDQSDIPTTIVISRWNGTTYQTVYTADKQIPDLAFSNPNTTILAYDLWTPTTIGQYRVCVTANASGDPVTSNNTICFDFNVSDGLNGTYTIGTANAGGQRNFTTIQEAVDALYTWGVTGPVVFELTDNNYTVGSFVNPNLPALDMSSRILGVSATNTVLFRPALLQSLSRAAIGIRLQSTNGVGILFGQNVSPNNPNAPQSQFKNATNAFVNSVGYITFDGGDQKSFRFMLDVGTATPASMPHRAVFYFGNGTSNTTVKNSLIENFPQSTASYASSLPNVRFLSQQFTFDDDVRSVANGLESYSAGIVSRSRVPSVGGNNSLGLDTLTNNNNRIEGNEITGFGYGVVMLGAGPLYFLDLSPVNSNSRFQRYYDKNNVITGNLIQSVRRAGVYIGYSENATISRNRIINVGIGATTLTGDAAGIMAGGQARANQFSYNNIGTRIERNEVSNISSDVAARGIYVEQTANVFTNPSGGTVTFPDVNESVRVSGNMVYSIDRTTTSATSAGIHLTTSRSQTVTGLTQLITPVATAAGYFSRMDSVYNNTVVMMPQTVSNGATVVGVGLQQVRGATVVNNAIAVTASASAVNTAAGNVYAGLFYQGVMPKVTGGLTSNRNAFWTPNAAIARFIETDGNSQILELGAQNDYTNLGQWKAWTAQDVNSVVGNFPAEHAVVTTATPNRLRVQTNPLPLGSILDRRGERIGANMTDLDGDPRGLNGSRFTIGADEFVGRLYVNDIEAIEVLSPVSYRAGSGTFSDAEYIMTQAPVNVQARMRNGGSASQAGVQIRCEIRDMNNSVVSQNTQTITVGTGESVDINFPMSFNPVTYSDMGVAAPAPFTTMARNVTPVYTINVFTVTDENNANNQVSKQVRFYLMRSGFKIMTSSVMTAVNANVAGTAFGEVVGKLNHDSLVQAFNYVNLTPGSYDIFDRLSWEPRAVNYAMYRTMFWSEDTSRLARQQRQDIRAFLAAGTALEKKNLVMASQEIVGKHVGLDAINDQSFVRQVLRADINASTGASQGAAPFYSQNPLSRTPRAAGYDNQQIIGQAVAQGIRETLRMTTNAQDGAAPRPSMMRVYSDATTAGIARVAYSYVTRDAGVTDSVMGVASTTLTTNVVFLGADWRHFPRTGVNQGGERVLRAAVEFIERNSGSVLPVELLAFDAKRSGNAVAVTWETASEKDLSHFDVERSTVSEKGNSVYAPVATVSPKGGAAVTQYETMDRSASSSVSYSYRLKMVDLDGTVKYSQEVLVGGESRSSLTVSPNPAITEATVTLNLGGSGEVELTVVDVNGRVVLEMGKGELSGTTVTVDTRELPSGSYTVVAKQGGVVTTASLRVVK